MRLDGFLRFLITLKCFYFHVDGSLTQAGQMEELSCFSIYLNALKSLMLSTFCYYVSHRHLLPACSSVSIERSSRSSEMILILSAVLA